MTADEIEQLAVISAEVRIDFARAQVTALQWEPQPCPPEWRPARFRPLIAL